MRNLSENDKYLHLQSSKKYAYLEAYMSGPAKWRGSGASSYPHLKKVY